MSLISASGSSTPFSLHMSNVRVTSIPSWSPNSCVFLSRLRPRPGIACRIRVITPIGTSSSSSFSFTLFFPFFNFAFPFPLSALFVFGSMFSSSSSFPAYSSSSVAVPAIAGLASCSLSRICNKLGIRCGTTRRPRRPCPRSVPRSCWRITSCHSISSSEYWSTRQPHERMSPTTLSST
ncbi:unnamed protein product [Periconia digitata]|uniref:Uncharacterized protein n=1 Tax=Periconia digitata TaxID=1303443 RepID=A0A9W4UVF1_9PLEO|nr:unnamed protein product [Periconia digitata]